MTAPTKPDDTRELYVELEVLENAIRRIRSVSKSFRDDLAPGIALACVELERMAADLRAQLAAVERDGKVGGR